MTFPTRLAVLLTGGAILLFWTAAALATPYTLFHMLNAVAIGGSVAVLIAYAPAVWESLGRKQLTPAHAMIVGVMLNWVGLHCRQLAYYLTPRMFEIPISPETYSGPAFYLWVFGLFVSLIGGAYMVTAVAVAGGKFPMRAIVAAALVAGSILTLVLILFGADELRMSLS